jgi:hypothetical protein
MRFTPMKNRSISAHFPSLRAGLLSLTVTLGIALHAQAEEFKLVVMPDTQWGVQKWPHVIDDMAKWVSANKDKENIKYVLHMGDMVQVGGAEQEWKNFDQTMKIMEAGKVPYILGVGNHDYDRLAKGKSTALFNKYFPLERISKSPGFGGAFPEGKSDNSFVTFKAGGKSWLVVALQYAPNNAEIGWANEVIGKHLDHQVILVTHSYLTHTGRDEIGNMLWEKLVRHHPNIAMVFCGHLSTVNFRSKGDAGNSVCEMLFDWQNGESPDPNSYLVLVNIDTDARKITTKAYSPNLDKGLTEGRTGTCKYEEVVFMPGDPEAVKKAAEAIAKPQAEAAKAE